MPKPWTKAELNHIRTELVKGVTISSIAVPGRTLSGIYGKIDRLGWGPNQDPRAHTFIRALRVNIDKTLYDSLQSLAYKKKTTISLLTRVILATFIKDPYNISTTDEFLKEYSRTYRKTRAKGVYKKDHAQTAPVDTTRTNPDSRVDGNQREGETSVRKFTQD